MVVDVEVYLWRFVCGFGVVEVLGYEYEYDCVE